MVSRMSETGRLETGFPAPERMAMMRRIEAEERFDHPASAAATAVRHIGRTFARPAAVRRSKDGFNYPIFLAIQRPNEYHYTSSIRSFRRLADMSAFAWPTRIFNSMHDVLTPACGLPHGSVAGSEIRIVEASSHAPFYEQLEAYRATGLAFLNRLCGGL
jgi:proline iminopeptidase